MPEWLRYTGTDTPIASQRRLELPEPPPWRRFFGRPGSGELDLPMADSFRAKTFQATDSVIETVNAALYLRRPLLLTGKPGVGKSSLGHSVARELALGAVLRWPITSRSTLADGLYRYDAIARLQQANLHRIAPGNAESAISATAGESGEDVGRYIRLGPLGTALVPRHQPRVLIIDELDKSDIDLPNDLLNIFEEGEFEIPELARLSDSHPTVRVTTADAGHSTEVTRGVVRCFAFPFVVITNNEEREFPTAFLRRCITLEIEPPDADMLAAIAEAHLGPEATSSGAWLIERFLQRRELGELATDQLLNAIYIVHRGLAPTYANRDELAEKLLPYLGTL